MLNHGEAKTDKRDAFVIADTGRTRRRQVHWLDAGSDDQLDQLGVLNRFDIDLAADQTRITNRLRDALMRIFREVPGHRLVATGGGGPSETIFTRPGEPKDALRC